MTRAFLLSRIIIVLFLILCTTCIPTAAAAEHTVAPYGAEFTSIQAAIDWASSR